MKFPLHVIGLTGGIATGKTTCGRFIQELFPDTVLFDADAMVKILYQNTNVTGQLKDHFGEQIMMPCGKIDKAYLRRRVFANTADKTFIESVFHPILREECLALLADTVKKNTSSLFVADIPLLFENGFDFGQSVNLLVATSRETQVRRLKTRNKWDDNTVDAVLASQIPIETKFILADVVFWNEGPLEILHAQCRRFIQSLELESA